MIEVRLEFATVAEAAEFFAGAALPRVDARGLSREEAATDEIPGKKSKSGKKKLEAGEPQAQGAGASAADPVAGILASQAPVMLAPGPVAGTAVVANPPAQIVEQTDLIATFTALGKAKSRDAFLPILSHFNATAVIGPAGVGIPQDKWAEAVAMCNKALAA